MTEYVILERVNGIEGENERWAEWSRMPARSGQSAVRKMIERSPESQGGTFVAVPARSWRTVTVKVETKTALKFS